MKRARDAASKAQRREAILAGAVELFELVAYDDLTMSSLARHVGLAKGTLYLYFSSKAELFLEVLTEHQVAWLGSATSALSSLGVGGDPTSVARVIALDLEGRAMLLRLMALRHHVLERAVDPKTSMRHRRRLRDAMMPLGEAIEGALPGLDVGEGFRVMLWCQAAVVGVHQLANPPQPAKDALKALDLAMFRVDFADELTSMLAATLAGALSR